MGEETPVRVIDAYVAAPAGPAKANVQFKETGIRLTVTPHVTNNRQVLMQLHTERSAIQPLAAADLGFIFQKQKADNQLLVEDGETAVIGGLTVTQVTKTRTGIPLLGGLPIIGKLFSFSSDQENRRDLIILVTPRITDDGASDAVAAPRGTVRAPRRERARRRPGSFVLPPHGREGRHVHLRFSTAGESHGKALVALVEGLPAGLPRQRRVGGPRARSAGCRATAAARA